MGGRVSPASCSSASFSSRKGIALGLALFGTALVCFSGGSLNAEPSVLGIVCGLISGLCYASHFPFYVWWQPRYSTATLYACTPLGGALALLPFVDSAPTRSWTAWANLLALGVVTNYGASRLAHAVHERVGAKSTKGNRASAPPSSM